MSITIQTETWHPFIDEIQPMLPLHWEELALNRDKVPLDPRYDMYEVLDAQNALLVVSIRDNGVVRGYFIGIVNAHMHYSSQVVLAMDIFWLHPDIRGKGMLGVKLFREVENEAKRRGVHTLLFGSKLHKDASRLFDFLKMKPIETYYSKWIGD